MANEIVISRLTELPVNLAANTMYIIKKPNEATANLVFTGNDASNVGSTLNFDDVSTVAVEKAALAVRNGKSVFVAPTITAMHALVPNNPALAFVLDTSADPLAKTPTGGYVYDPDYQHWLPLPSGAGEQDPVQWADIVNRPTASVAQIDNAVSSAHTHANRTTLNMLSDLNGALAYNGSAVSNVSVFTTW